ncbi:MAG: hypothetical protein HY681_13425, partial [Chloroflexi bacterium]|nr:hypothetical protein [Chloroflexota bacterium]
MKSDATDVSRPNGVRPRHWVALVAFIGSLLILAALPIVERQLVYREVTSQAGAEVVVRNLRAWQLLYAAAAFCTAKRVLLLVLARVTPSQVSPAFVAIDHGLTALERSARVAAGKAIKGSAGFAALLRRAASMSARRVWRAVVDVAQAAWPIVTAMFHALRRLGRFLWPLVTWPLRQLWRGVKAVAVASMVPSQAALRGLWWVVVLLAKMLAWPFQT